MGADSTATIVVVVMATFTRVNSMRRGLRAASRSPSSNGTGRWAATATRSGRRFGTRAEFASADVVLVCAARMDGIQAANNARATANATTKPTPAQLKDAAATLPTSPAPGLATSGAARYPAASPTAAPTSARLRYSSSSTPATSRGVAPTAFNMPTRRVRSASRPPTITARLAMASRSRSELAINRPRWNGFDCCASV